MKPYGVNLSYCKLRQVYLTEFIIEISKVYDIGLRRYRNKKIRVCGKDLISFLGEDPVEYITVDWLYDKLYILKGIETGISAFNQVTHSHRE